MIPHPRVFNDQCCYPYAFQRYNQSKFLFVLLAIMIVQQAEPKVPGLLMRLIQCNSDHKTAPETVLPNVDQVYTATAHDGKTPSHLTLYILSDVTPLLSSASLYDQDVESQAGDRTLSWVVCGYINGRKKGTPPTTTVTHFVSHNPSEGSRLVVNGSSPRQGKEDDYHGWYNSEHGPMLSLVPGWNENKRYRLEKSYGDVDVASFYGLNFYDAENGLGGPEWKASTDTEWTQRVRSNHERPNIRRVWNIHHS